MSTAREMRKATQRERLLDAMLDVAVRHGYAQASVTRTIAAAGVSRPTFYDYFADRDECFIAALRLHSARLVEHVERAASEAPSHEALQAAADATCAFAEAQPEQMCLLADESLAAGPRAMDVRDATVDALVDAVERRLESANPKQSAPDIPFRALLGGLQRLIAPLLRRGESELSDVRRDVRALLQRFERPLSEHQWHTLEPGPMPPPSPFTAELPLRPPPPIPPGRSLLPTHEIAANQRTRILFATGEVAMAKGYNATTVADIATAAKVDKRVFYSHFKDKQEAFLAIHELAVQQTLAVAARAYFSATDWPERVWRGIRATTQLDDTYPMFAHVGYVEARAVGAPAIQQIEDSRTTFTLFLHEGAAQSETPPSATTMRTTVEAIFEIGYHHARSHLRTKWELSRMTGHAVHIALTPLLGDRAPLTSVCD